MLGNIPHSPGINFTQPDEGVIVGYLEIKGTPWRVNAVERRGAKTSPKGSSQLEIDCFMVGG